ncbi:hypothetical protein OS188_09275 [Xanthomarina sp. F1114]|uniref:hypothetical protein n=1 Tax=Xanthomarina sp. F1114 TaxID=2996019 RepID=UPI00225DFBB8|nr:hypothetical protein [Xanthomarina sp. F1114]MCX7548143.1 hypothetical protein [Xanthomarina sp. F1114]
MKTKFITLIICFMFVFGQAQQIDLSKFTLSNGSSPAFILVGETPTEIYTPVNLKALTLHVQENFGESISIEATPYFLINTKRKDRSYQKYIGVLEDPDSGAIVQKPFSGLNTTTISFAYVDKEFSGLENEHKTYSIGLRTTVLRFYNKEKVHANTIGMATALSNITVPNAILIQGEEAIQHYYQEHQDEINALIEPFQKQIKPLFRLDAAMGYSALFKENKTNSGTANRLGIWLTAETSLILNEGSDAKTNNYFNLLLTARYVEDGFNALANNYYTMYYRDFGGKLEFEFGKLGFGYEYIARNGEINSERSVGSIQYTITKDLSISGGFGKNFEGPDGENLLTIIGINWGINTGNNKVGLN